MGKKNNQTLVSDVDQESPTLRSTNNAGNSVNLISSIIHLPSIGISRSASGTSDRFYLSFTDYIMTKVLTSLLMASLGKHSGK